MPVEHTSPASPVRSPDAPRLDPPRPWRPAVRMGLLGRCPACGTGRLFGRYLEVADTCGACGEELHHQRTDDAPPYVTILLVGHLVVPLVLVVERTFSPPTWVHAMLWLPLALISALLILPLAKGALVGLQWALRMHGFGKDAENGGGLLRPPAVRP